MSIWLGRSWDPVGRGDTVVDKMSLSFLQAQLLKVFGFLQESNANALSLICMLEVLMHCDVSYK